MQSKPLDLGLLRSFSPLDGLKTENLSSLARKTVLREQGRGRMLFRQGDSDRRSYYLVSGTVELVRDGQQLMTVRGGSPDARNALSPFTPRRCSARVLSDKAEYICIDSDMLDMMLTWDQTGTYEVSELYAMEAPSPDSGDWMTTLLQTKAFHRIPAANIQAIFMRMQRIELHAGDQVLKQGDDGDYFYVIVSGKCEVTRETPLNSRGIKLAELGMGDTFGEEALICDSRRNASVTMLTDGALMRLGKDDFRELLNEPMLHRVSLAQARRIIDAGGQWLDVRLPSEYDTYHLEGALSVPLYFLRLKLAQLDPQVHYVVYCDTGRRSAAGAYILSERDLNASVLDQGLSAEQVREENLSRRSFVSSVTESADDQVAPET